MKKETKQLLAMKCVAEQKSATMLWDFDNKVKITNSFGKEIEMTLTQAQEIVKLHALQEKQGYLLDTQIEESRKILEKTPEQTLSNFTINQLINEPVLNMKLNITSQNMERIQNENELGTMHHGSVSLENVKDLYFDGEELLIDSNNGMLSSINIEKELKTIKHGVEQIELKGRNEERQEEKIKEEREVEMVYRKASAISEIYAMVCSGQMSIDEAMIQVAAIGNIRNNVKQNRAMEMSGQMEERTEEERAINSERPNEYNSEEITFEEYLDLSTVCDISYDELQINLDEIVQQEIVEDEIEESYVREQ